MPVAVWPVQEFTYLAPFRYAGTRREDRHEAVERYWERLDPMYRDGEGAESFLGSGIAEAFLDRMAEASGHVAVFTHGQFLRGVMLRVLCGRLGVEEAMFRFRAFRQAVAIPNAAMVVIGLSRRAPVLGPVVTDHLPPELLST